MCGFSTYLAGCLVALTTVLAVSCGDADGSGDWLIEDEVDTAQVMMRGRDQEGARFEVIAPKGLTLWYAHRLMGSYRIRYTARMVTVTPQERLSDLNCFWAATDPKNPETFFSRTFWRDGIFKHYNSLDLFYVGYGGNENTTTRFRRYDGDRFPEADEVIKPILKEYTDPAHLLSPDTDYRIEITVIASRSTTFAVNGEVLFSHKLTPGEGDGYFGLRLLENHVLISGFKIEYL